MRSIFQACCWALVFRRQSDCFYGSVRGYLGVMRLCNRYDNICVLQVIVVVSTHCDIVSKMRYPGYKKLALVERLDRFSFCLPRSFVTDFRFCISILYSAWCVPEPYSCMSCLSMLTPYILGMVACPPPLPQGHG